MKRVFLLGASSLVVAAWGCSSESASNPGGTAKDAGANTDASTRPGADAGQSDAARAADSGGGGADSGGGADAANAKTCADASLLFCDDFEGYSAGPATSTKWQTETGTANDTLTIDGTHARGSKALHAHTSQNGHAFAKLTNFNPPNNSFFGRMHIWVTAFPTAPEWAHFTLVEAAGDSAYVVRPIGGQYVKQAPAGSYWGVGSDQGTTGDWTNWKTTAPTQSGTWLCMEWEMRAQDDVINVWIDGVAKPELSVSKTDHGGQSGDFVFPTFTSVRFGWQLYQSGSTPDQFDLWFDDVALATTRLGC
jgi:hypothetical protein